MYFDHYGKREFWETKYKNNSDTFNWFQDFDEFKDLLYQFMKNKKEPILNIGCGTDETSEKLYKDGFNTIMNIDFSTHCINAMKEKYKKINNNLLFIQMDCWDLAFQNENFKFIIDKGTMDCLSCGYRSNYNIKKYLSEVFNVLKEDGKFFLISQQQPEKWKKYIDGRKWDYNNKILYNSSYIENKLKIKQEYIPFSESLFQDKNFENQQIKDNIEEDYYDQDLINKEKVKENINTILKDLKNEKNNISNHLKAKDNFHFLYILTKKEISNVYDGDEMMEFSEEKSEEFIKERKEDSSELTMQEQSCDD